MIVPIVPTTQLTTGTPSQAAEVKPSSANTTKALTTRLAPAVVTTLRRVLLRISSRISFSSSS